MPRNSHYEDYFFCFLSEDHYNPNLSTYCLSTKNLRNYAFVCLFNEIFVVKYKKIDCRICGRIIYKSGNRSDVKNGRISGPILPHCVTQPIRIFADWNVKTVDKACVLSYLFTVHLKYSLN